MLLNNYSSPSIIYINLITDGKQGNLNDFPGNPGMQNRRDDFTQNPGNVLVFINTCIYIVSDFFIIYNILCLNVK